VESFANSTNLISYNNSFNTINYYIDESMKTIMQRNSYIKSYKLYIANEALSGTTFNASSLDVFLCLDAKQIELNFLEKKTIAFKHMFKDFYKNFRENFRVFKKKKTSEKKLKKDEQKLITNENYNIIDFYKDLQIQLCKQLYKTTKIVGASSDISFCQ
ncbi:MAG: hypothetical protein IJ990_03555, partial [Alistipes sp.]|nr:hypothetical protein [Alistipes sp.]